MGVDVGTTPRRRGISMAIKTHGNRNGSKWLRNVTRYALYARDGFRCVYCNVDLSNVANDARTIDHITPRDFGGNNDVTNLVTSCRRCNDTKRNMTLQQWAKRININPATVIEQSHKPLPDRKIIRTWLVSRGMRT